MKNSIPPEQEEKHWFEIEVKKIDKHVNQMVIVSLQGK